MLTTQIQYWTLQETKRHDKVTEKETSKHNRATEDLGYKTLDEQVRHNKQQEAYWFQSLEETIRSHRASEDIGWANVDIGLKNAVSNARQAGAAEMNAATNRWNAQANYSLGLEANSIAQENADINRERMRAENILGFQNQNNNEAQIEVSQQNANTAEMSAEAQAKRWKHQSMTDTWSNVNDSVSTATSGVKDVSSAISNFTNLY